MNEPAPIVQLRATLRALYDQWRDISEAEGIAISTGQWSQLESLQKSKQQLQTFIDSAKHDLRTAGQACGQAARELEREFQSMIVELLALEAQNRQILDTRRNEATAEEHRLLQAVQTLHQIRGAYASPHLVSWQSYS